MKSALRIGFLGYLFNLAPLGIIGGDLLKVVMLSRQFHRKRAKSFASVIVDRVIGLYVLFIVASVAILLTGFWRLPRPEIRVICLIVWVLTAVGTVGILILASPALTGGRLTRVLGGLPYVGRPINSLFEALRLYRSKPGVLATAVLMSAAVHSLFTIGVYFIALGLYKNSLVLPLADHFVMLPVSGATGVIPLCVGPMEAVLGLLYGLLYDVGVVVLPPGVGGLRTGRGPGLPDHHRADRRSGRLLLPGRPTRSRRRAPRSRSRRCGRVEKRGQDSLLVTPPTAVGGLFPQDRQSAYCLPSAACFWNSSIACWRL